MSEQQFSVEHLQLESGRYVQVLNYERDSAPVRLILGTVDEEREATAMSTALENALLLLTSETPKA